MLRHGSRSFHAASFLLPRRVREPATALYAFCRLADDAVDLEGGKLAAVDRLRHRLDAVYRGEPLPHPADRALADIVRQFVIPRELPDALMDGLEWDATGRRYPDLASLEAYSARVAGTVGAMMALLMGVRSPRLLARACDLGVAMQLTNIARDVGEDARLGRLYLPLDWLAEAGIDPDRFLARPVHSEPLAAVMARLLASAERLYVRADTGIDALPSSCRPGIRAARLIYAEIGNQLARSGLDSVSRRTTVSTRRKLVLLGRALRATQNAERDETPCLTEARFLVAAAAGAPAVQHGAAHPPISWWNFPAQAAWVIELFERLERRHRVGEAAEAASSA